MNGVMVEFPGGHGRQDHHQSPAERDLLGKQKISLDVREDLPAVSPRC